MSKVRYDGLSDWYDEFVAEEPSQDYQALAGLLGTGSGWCLDLGCGTGLYVDAIRSTGRSVVGLDLSADQLRLARRRTGLLARGDASRLPFADGAFDAVAAVWVSTDVDDFGGVVREAVRVLRPGGAFVFLGAHPCFNGPCIENREDGARIIHPEYRNAGWHRKSPWWRENGIRDRVGMRHVPLSELLNSVIAAGLSITDVIEPRDDPIPAVLALRAQAGRQRISVGR